jgi:hypothetical protein
VIHLRTTHPEYGAVPLCGNAMWDGLASHPDINQCWECASIAGAYSPDLQERFGVNADGTEVNDADATSP